MAKWPILAAPLVNNISTLSSQFHPGDHNIFMSNLLSIHQAIVFQLGRYTLIVLYIVFPEIQLEYQKYLFLNI